ncbi:hypothetical protein EMIT0215P_10242 [Pseudomonas serboccidentalis]
MRSKVLPLCPKRGHRRVTRKQIVWFALKEKSFKKLKPLIYKAFKKLARLLLSLWHNKNKKLQTNKNKTYRL